MARGKAKPKVENKKVEVEAVEPNVVANARAATEEQIATKANRITEE